MADVQPADATTMVGLANLIARRSKTHQVDAHADTDRPR
jgi:hypothetical protein